MYLVYILQIILSLKKSYEIGESKFTQAFQKSFLIIRFNFIYLRVVVRITYIIITIIKPIELITHVK